jgi:adenosine deaminase
MEGYEHWRRRQMAGTLQAARACRDLAAATILSPEDGWLSRTQFALQFRVIDEEWRALQKEHPGDAARLSPHGGELTLEFSPYADLRSRIGDALAKCHASRLGRSVSIMWDDDAYAILKTMRDQKIAMKLCLTSNYGILNVTPERHPFRLHREAGAPLVLDTDDEGISRGDLTVEYLCAAQLFDLG